MVTQILYRKDTEFNHCRFDWQESRKTPVRPSQRAPWLHLPNLSGLAARSTRFANAYTGSPLCAPGRASFLSGQLPSATGVYDNAAEFPYRVARGGSWNEEEVTIRSAIRDTNHVTRLDDRLGLRLCTDLD